MKKTLLLVSVSMLLCVNTLYGQAEYIIGCAFKNLQGVSQIAKDNNALVEMTTAQARWFLEKQGRNPASISKTKDHTTIVVYPKPTDNDGADYYEGFAFIESSPVGSGAATVFPFIIKDSPSGVSFEARGINHMARYAEYQCDNAPIMGYILGPQDYEGLFDTLTSQRLTKVFEKSRLPNITLSKKKHDAGFGNFEAIKNMSPSSTVFHYYESSGNRYGMVIVFTAKKAFITLVQEEGHSLWKYSYFVARYSVEQETDTSLAHTNFTDFEKTKPFPLASQEEWKFSGKGKQQADYLLHYNLPMGLDVSGMQLLSSNLPYITFQKKGNIVRIIDSRLTKQTLDSTSGFFSYSWNSEISISKKRRTYFIKLPDGRWCEVKKSLFGDIRFKVKIR